MNISYKVALKFLESKNISEMRNVLLNIVDEIKKGKIKDRKEFIVLLKSAEITDRDVLKIIQDEINSNKSIIDFIKYLGDSGVGFIPNSWFSRNLQDNDIKRRIPQNYWNILRSPEWIKQHTL